VEHFLIYRNKQIMAQDKKENMKENKKTYNEKKKEIIKEKKKEYQEKNKEQKKEYDKKRYLEKKEEKKEKRKNYYNINKESIKLYNKEYCKKYQKERQSKDPLFKLMCNIKKNICSIIKSNGYTKKSRTYQILGCSFEDFKIYIENQFESWMSWDNYGNPKDSIFEPNKTWDIDHIIPLASVTNEEELLKLNHYTNLQPLCSYNNRWIKGKNY